MNYTDLLKGIGLIILNLYCYKLAYSQYKKDNYSVALWCIVLSGFVLRLWCITDPFLHEWDERYHALVAKNLLTNPLKPTLFVEPILDYDFRQWTHNHVWLHKQPLSLWCIALSIKLFGCYEWAIRLPSLIFSLLAIVMTYKIAFFITKSREKALLAAFFHAANGFVIELASGRGATDHVDNTFFFFIETAVFLTTIYVEKQRFLTLVGVGVALGCALLTKSFPALIVLPIFFLLSVDSIGFKRTAAYSFVLILVAFSLYLPWQYYIFQQFPNEAQWENNYNFQHLYEAVEGHSGEWWWHLDEARIVWNELIYIIFLWFLFYFFKNRSDKKLWALLIWIMLPYVFFSAVATKMWAYILFTAPAIFIVEASFLVHIKHVETRFTHLKNIVFYVVVLLAIRYSYERVKPFPNATYKASVYRAQKIKEFAPFFLGKDKNIVFGLDNYIECMFYHDNTIAYLNIPNDGIMDSLKRLNYTLFIADYPTKDAPILRRVK